VIQKVEKTIESKKKSKKYSRSVEYFFSSPFGDWSHSSSHIGEIERNIFILYKDKKYQK